MFGIQHFHDHFKLAKEIDSSTERKNEKDKDKKNTGLIGFARFPPGLPPFHIRQGWTRGSSRFETRRQIKAARFDRRERRGTGRGEQ